MPKPCKECPFSVTNPTKSATSEGLVMFVGEVCAGEGQICHLSESSECEGARRFFEGDDGVFPSILELVKVRDPETLATEFFSQLERLMTNA